MGRLPSCVLLLEFPLLVSACAGCWGGSSVTQPPPPVPDFSLSLSTNSISISQGGAGSVVNVSINPTNGFTGNVQVALSGLPSGVTSNPASPFDAAAGATISVAFRALLIPVRLALPPLAFRRLLSDSAAREDLRERVPPALPR